MSCTIEISPSTTDSSSICSAVVECFIVFSWLSVSIFSLIKTGGFIRTWVGYWMMVRATGDLSLIVFSSFVVTCMWRGHTTYVMHDHDTRTCSYQSALLLPEFELRARSRCVPARLPTAKSGAETPQIESSRSHTWCQLPMRVIRPVRLDGLRPIASC